MQKSVNVEWFLSCTSVYKLSHVREKGIKCIIGNKFFYFKNAYLKIIFTINRKCIFLSRTSSARWLRIRRAGSRLKCSSFSRSCMWIDVVVWSNLYASTKWDQRIFFPAMVRHLGFPAKLLFSILLRIFLKLCYKCNYNIIKGQPDK